MTNWITNDIISFLISLACAGILIPQILVIAYRKNLFDSIDGRKIHTQIVPRLGGLSFFPSIFFSIVLIAGISIQFGLQTTLSAYSATAVQICFLGCAVMIMYAVGMVDDLVGVRYIAKFVVQIIAAILLVSSGSYITDLHDFLWLPLLPDWIGYALTIFCIVFIVNAINLIDGIDGLASGLCIVAFIFYSIVFYSGQEYVFSMIASASAGTLIPFFYYNVFGKAARHKKIFMGDTGALTIGMILAFCTINIINMEQVEIIGSDNTFVVAVTPLIIPCFDVVRVYLHRVIRHRNPFLPDKCHIHHKLLALGLSQRAALCIIMLWSALFIIVNILLSPFINPTILIAADVILWTSVNIILTQSISCKERRIGEKIYD